MGIWRVEGAEHALVVQAVNAEPTRAAALLFVADTLLDQARAMARALAVHRAEA